MYTTIEDMYTIQETPAVEWAETTPWDNLIETTTASSSRSNINSTNYFLFAVVFISVLLIAYYCLNVCSAFRQKSRDASNPSILVTGSRTARCQPAGLPNQPSVFVTPVSMAHMPSPPPKYEYEFAPPPKYEEVVGIHALQESQSSQLPPAPACPAPLPAPVAPRSDPSMA